LKVSIIFGTRPEVIKLISIIKLFRQHKQVTLDVCFTGQHKEMVLPLLDFFEVKVDHSLEIMKPGQTLAELTANAVQAIDKYLEIKKPDIVFVQGDTTTAMCAATAAFYRKIKVAHVEAGLRTFDIFSPFPEEFNRQVISKITDLHFAPTESARENLAKENIGGNKVFVTGNTVIDTLLYTKDRLKDLPANKNLWDKDERKIVLITGHRRESFGNGFENICEAIRQLSLRYPNYNFVYPVHLNPNVQEPVHRLLSGLSNVYLIAPLDYIDFTRLMVSSYLILTDSGGVQEEAPSLGKPVLIMRETTERMEAVTCGAARLVGTDIEKIINNASELIEKEEVYRKMSNAGNPFGDGLAGKRIVEHTLSSF
jgi:UDP-N-acetylglucosamine 2-epimerase (non-hydrolysing)